LAFLYNFIKRLTVLLAPISEPPIIIGHVGGKAERFSWQNHLIAS